MGRKERRISPQTAAVLEHFVADPRRRSFGREILLETDIASGSLYPILINLEERGMLRSEWETIDEGLAQRRRRRLYWLDPNGVARARSALDEYARARAMSAGLRETYA